MWGLGRFARRNPDRAPPFCNVVVVAAYDRAPRTSPDLAIDAPTLLRASAWLLAGAAAVGTGLIGLRFGFDRPPPRWLRRVHGAFAAGGLSTLVYAWAVVGISSAGSIALALLAAAAAGGVVTVRARRWGLPASSEVLAFGHLSIAAMGYVMLLAAVIGGHP